MKKPKTSPANGFRYAGPEYRNGIILAGTSQPIHPAEFTRDQAAVFVAAHPEKTWWWNFNALPELPADNEPDLPEASDTETDTPPALD